MLRPIALVAMLCAASPPARAQCFDSIQLLVEPGEPSYRCNGASVAIAGDLAFMGNACGDENSYPYHGYVTAWSFDAAEDVWTIEGRLAPSDGGEHGPSMYGAGVATSGDTAIVPAFLGLYPQYSGRVYVYERAGGAWPEVAMWEADSPFTNDTFGYAVAIDGDWAIVSALGESASGNRKGAAYFFHRTNGIWNRHQRVIASVGAERDGFGWSVDIDGGLAVVGAPHGGNEAAYVFRLEGDEWVERQVLHGSGAEPLDFFGKSVAVDEGRIVVAAPGFDGREVGSGGLFVFEHDAADDVWVQTHILVKDTPLMNERMGDAQNGATGVSIEGEFILAAVESRGLSYLFASDGPSWREGAIFTSGGSAVSLGGQSLILGDRHTEGGRATVSRCPIGKDTDGDGLLDSWESEGEGIDINDDGTIDLDLYALGARPDHKDLFIEIDVMDGGSFSQSGLDTVVSAFGYAPIENPDGFQGITLHALVDELDIPHAPVWDDAFADYDNIKAFYFGTPGERAHDNTEHILAAKGMAFRYCIVVDAIEDDTLGLAEQPGNDMYVGLGGLSAANIDSTHPFEWWFAVTFMHELGHTLGLTHGGGFDPDPDNPGRYKTVNYKPNYVSVMNYGFDTVSVAGELGPTPPVTFSWEALPPLDESNLDETIGVTSAALLYENHYVRYSKQRADGSQPTGWLLISAPGQASADYNGDGDRDDTGVVADLNARGAGASPGELMNGFNDWALVQLGIGAGGNWEDFVHEPLEEPELSDAMATEHREETPPPPFGCRADTNRDGVADTRDVLAFLNLFAAGKGAADFNLDGGVDTRDVLAFLNDWAAGC